jgi:hypothetical protein
MTLPAVCGIAEMLAKAKPCGRKGEGHGYDSGSDPQEPHACFHQVFIGADGHIFFVGGWWAAGEQQKNTSKTIFSQKIE